MEEGRTEAGRVYPSLSANSADTQDLAFAVCVVAAAAATGTKSTSRRDHPPQDLRSMVDAPARRLSVCRRPQDERLGEEPRHARGISSAERRRSRQGCLIYVCKTSPMNYESIRTAT